MTRNMPYWITVLSGKTYEEAKVFVKRELKQLRATIEPAVAKNALLRTFETEEYWERVFYKSRYGKVMTLTPEEAKVLMGNILRPPIGPRETFVAETQFVKTYGLNTFLNTFKRDPQPEPELPTEISGEIQPLPEPGDGPKVEEIVDPDNDISDIAVAMEAAKINPEELIELIRKYEQDEWKKLDCSFEGCKLKADGTVPKPERCRHHKDK